MEIPQASRHKKFWSSYHHHYNLFCIRPGETSWRKFLNPPSIPTIPTIPTICFKKVGKSEKRWESEKLGRGGEKKKVMYRKLQRKFLRQILDDCVSGQESQYQKLFNSLLKDEDTNIKLLENFSKVVGECILYNFFNIYTKTFSPSPLQLKNLQNAFHGARVRFNAGGGIGWISGDDPPILLLNMCASECGGLLMSKIRSPVYLKEIQKYIAFTDLDFIDSIKPLLACLMLTTYDVMIKDRAIKNTTIGKISRFLATTESALKKYMPEVLANIVYTYFLVGDLNTIETTKFTGGSRFWISNFCDAYKGVD